MGAASVDKLPGGRDWRAAVEAVEVPRKATFLGR
jgi:hypothetical protein